LLTYPKLPKLSKVSGNLRNFSNKYVDLQNLGNFGILVTWAVHRLSSQMRSLPKPTILLREQFASAAARALGPTAMGSGRALYFARRASFPTVRSRLFMDQKTSVMCRRIRRYQGVLGVDVGEGRGCGDCHKGKDLRGSKRVKTGQNGSARVSTGDNG